MVNIQEQTIKYIDDELIKIIITPDYMQAKLILSQCIDGEEYTFEDIKNKIDEQNIVYGVDDAVINEIKNNREYDKSYVIANGKYPVNGKNGYLEYYFDVNSKVLPKINEDGSVDFHHLNLIKNVQKGQELVRKIDKIDGVDGIDVLGRRFPAAPVKDINLPKKGKNVDINEEGTMLFSTSDGQVDLKNNRLTVFEVYYVKGDVDNSTGNINFNGSVEINGNVLTGFSIKSKKNIVVNGIVEGATLIAGGNIIIKGGIQGMDKSRIICNGMMCAKYINNSFVKSNGSIETNIILHSEVSCNDIINVDGAKGLISGGKIRANKQINAKVIGTFLGTKTYVEVGVDPDVLEQYNILKKEVLKNDKEIKKLEKILKILEERKKAGTISQARLIQLVKSKTTKKNLADENIKSKKILNKLKPIIENTTTGKVKVSSIIYPGTIVTIGSQSLIVNTNYDHCSLILDKGEVCVQPF